MKSIEPINTGNTRRSRSIAVFRKLNHKIDMTPMVDLGFLLITFFVFTATMSDPATMNLTMPKEQGAMPVAASGVFTVLIGNGNAIKYYEGELQQDGSNIKTTSIADIRRHLIRKKKEISMQYARDADCEARAIKEERSSDDCRQAKLMVLIKPTKDASYQSIVAMLDEMTINKIARYALLDPDAAELKLLL